jgi:hypothetical protein
MGSYPVIISIEPTIKDWVVSCDYFNRTHDKGWGRRGNLGFPTPTRNADRYYSRFCIRCINIGLNLFFPPFTMSAYKLPTTNIIIPINAIHVKTNNILQYLTLNGPVTEENREGELSFTEDWFSAEGFFELGCCK